ncbi:MULTISPECIES: bifunctional DNA primase/polymerase [Streptomyces]|uniref:Bifunctional DNA primase/polymerase n=1 Tax=Streptomyces chilikensis TaxID=1194079 RepID=A0ABV3EMD1_9ACTN|nr:bifunctional DNA primase/polymerase [Streptomyces sp. MJP52]
MENTITGTEVTPIPQQRGEAGQPSSGNGPGQGRRGSSSMLEAAVAYAEERQWQVFPGTSSETVEGVVRCSCGDPGCPLPGAHPEGPDRAGPATSSGTVARRTWTLRPEAAVLLPTGRDFDVLEVPETAGYLALARLDRLGAEPGAGPVLVAPDRRMRFLVLPGAVARVPRMVRELGWAPEALGLTVTGAGGWIAAPPTRYGARGPVQWVRPPAGRRLPDAAALVPALAYACTRDR